MRGRKPKPIVLKVLEGNPGKRPINEREPTAPPGIPDCPEYLDDTARGEWQRTGAVLREMGLLSLADRTALAAYCMVYSRWVQAEAAVKKYGAIVKSPEKGFPMKSPYLTVADQAMESEAAGLCGGVSVWQSELAGLFRMPFAAKRMGRHPRPTSANARIGRLSDKQLLPKARVRLLALPPSERRRSHHRGYLDGAPLRASRFTTDVQKGRSRSASDHRC